MGVAVFPAAGGGVTQKVQDFTSTGSFVTPSNCTAVQLLMVGGGGGGGFAKTTAGNPISSGGGGGGQVYEGLIAVTAGTTYTVTIGAGGAGSTAVGSAGGNGGSTTFGSLATANGGGGGAGIPSDYSGFTAPTRNGGYGGGNPSAAGGGGGGAGGHALWQGFAGTGPAQTWVNPVATSGSNNVGGMGGNLGDQGMTSYAGIGKYGLGNGGAGGQRTNDNYGGNVNGQSYSAGTGNPTVWMANTSSLRTGTAASANTGDGGGGATTLAAAGTSNGLAGGSGFARVIYWS